MATPEGWERLQSDAFPVDTPFVSYRGCSCEIYVGRNGMEVWSVGYIGDDRLRIKTPEQKDALISIIHRAWNQHVHLKAHPEGPVLGEEEEASG